MADRNIKLDTIVSQKTGLLAANLDEELVMLDVESGLYHGLNSIGHQIWRLIEQPISVVAVCDQLMQEYDVDTDTCHEQVLNFLNRLDRNNLLVVENA